MASRDNFSRYLQQMGIRTPYDMTEAKQEAMDSENPLARYGMMSGQQKARQEQMRQMYQAQLQAEQQQMEQMMLSQMPAQQQIGYHAGGGIAGGLESLIGALKKRGMKDIPEMGGASADAQGGMMGAMAPGDDPALARFNELAREVGPETALEMVGQETGNAAMIRDAQAQRMESQKKKLDMEDLLGRINDRKNKENPVLEFDTEIDGKPAKKHMEIIGKHPDGSNLYKEVSKGLKGQISDTNEGWQNSKGGRDKRLGDIENMFTNTANSLDTYDQLASLYQQESTAGGSAGKFLAKAENLAAGFMNLAQNVTQVTGQKVDASVDVNDYDWGKLEKVAGTSVKMRSLILALAYSNAAANGDTGRSLSDRDVQNQIDQIGGDINNPKIFMDLMDQNKKLLVSKLRNKLNYTDIDGTSALTNNKYRTRLQELEGRVGTKAQAPSQVPTITTKDEYDKLQSGDLYIDSRTGTQKRKK